MVFNFIFKFCWISFSVHRKARHVKVTKISNLELKLTVNQSQETKCYFGAKITKSPKMSEGMSAFAAYKSVEKKRIVEEPKKKKNRNRNKRNKVNRSNTYFKEFYI